jgi:hypothetical protein
VNGGRIGIVGVGVVIFALFLISSSRGDEVALG